MRARATAAGVLAASFLASCADDSPPEIAPPKTAAAVTADGSLTADEWDDALTVMLSADVDVLLMQDAANLYVGLRAAESDVARYADIFLAGGERPARNLHASMQVGERDLPPDGWDDAAPETQWGATTGWLANVVTLEPGKAESLPFRERARPYDGFEYVISKATLGGEGLRIRVEARDFEGEKTDLVYPPASDRFDPAGWALLQLANYPRRGAADRVFSPQNKALD